jgi:perosamine synthetase
MNAITAIANEYGLQVIEDACEAIGAEICGRRVGTFGNAAVFAFYPNKQMTTGEGGMIVTDDPHVAEVCRSLRNQGRDADGRWLRHVRLGYNYRLSDIHAALGLAQLERIEELLAARSAVARRYSELLPRHEVLQLPSEEPGMKRSWFVYTVRFRGDSRSNLRDRIRTHLQENGIGAQAYFPSIHRQPYFEQYHKGPIPTLPNTEDAASSSLAIPFSSRMSEPEIQYVCQEIMRGLDAEGDAPVPERLDDSIPSSVSPRFP